jgi:zinc transport system ATP-binding protein
VLIARALATEPELLILDEPAAGLDPQSQTELYDLLSRLADRLTVIVVSHHVNLVSSHVDLVVCVHDGHLHLPTTTEIGPELEDFFPDTRAMVLVRHEHHDCPEPEHDHG